MENFQKRGLVMAKQLSWKGGSSVPLKTGLPSNRILFEVARRAPAPFTHPQMRHKRCQHSLLCRSRLFVGASLRLCHAVAAECGLDLYRQRLAGDFSVVQECLAAESVGDAAGDAVAHARALGQDFLYGAKGNNLTIT